MTETVTVRIPLKSMFAGLGSDEMVRAHLSARGIDVTKEIKSRQDKVTGDYVYEGARRLCAGD